jgi:hypothetical protein
LKLSGGGLGYLTSKSTSFSEDLQNNRKTIEDLDSFKVSLLHLLLPFLLPVTFELCIRLVGFGIEANWWCFTIELCFEQFLEVANLSGCELGIDEHALHVVITDVVTDEFRFAACEEQLLSDSSNLHQTLICKTTSQQLVLPLVVEIAVRLAF